jgi:hypothetical protein
MRPIEWGAIFFTVGMLGWLAFSAISEVNAVLGHEAPPRLWALGRLSEALFFLSLPVAVVAEVIGWIMRRRARYY